MGLKMKQIAGSVYSRDKIEPFLRSRGFICRHGISSGYDLRIRDHISGEEFLLRIPVHCFHGEEKSNTQLRLGKPVIKPLKGNRPLNESFIPKHIEEATDQQIAEIFSYLNSNTLTSTYPR
ncbi:hypothetical protein SAMN06264849_102288 [Melghirimyces algeriensis]|uniref:YugN-like family protein n=1 Tax=Melghirimyces algeriensis TaxID=910412 RepID=A0A521BQ11_9BACL|nr:hypothetical protein SAMN06264849_102288 [Melghirimyces algeriensis]